MGGSIKAQNSVSHGRKETMTKEKYKNKTLTMSRRDIK